MVHKLIRYDTWYNYSIIQGQRLRHTLMMPLPTSVIILTRCELPVLSTGSLALTFYHLLIMGDDPDLNELDLSKTTAAVRPQSTTTSSSKDPLVKLVSLSKNRLKHRPEDDISVHPSSQPESSLADDSTLRPATNTFKQARHPQTTLNDLPPEIQDAIIGYLSGSLNSAASGASFETNGPRNWNMVMRHPRRKQLSDLALVTRVWRDLVQQRLYRHSKPVETRMYHQN